MRSHYSKNMTPIKIQTRAKLQTIKRHQKIAAKQLSSGKLKKNAKRSKKLKNVLAADVQQLTPGPVGPYVITITSPKEGDSYTSYQRVPLKWTSTAPAGSVYSIQLFQNGAYYMTIVDSVIARDAGYNVYIPYEVPSGTFHNKFLLRSK
jgi:hypothetical protein